MDVLLGPAHLGNVDKALDPGFEFDERTIFGDVGDAAVELGADRILGRRAFPRIALELLHAQRDTLRIAVDADDLHLQRIADAQHLRRVTDALVAEIGYVETAVGAAPARKSVVCGNRVLLRVDIAGLRTIKK